MAAQGYIYCLGGGGVWYYSPLSSSGVGAWTATTTSYPQTQASPACAPSGDYIYCIGGADYYAPILSSGRGLGAWTEHRQLPAPTRRWRIVRDSRDLPVLHRRERRHNLRLFAGWSITQLLSPSEGGGVSAWTITSNYPNGYPLGIRDESCVSSGGYLYCVGGIDFPLPDQRRILHVDLLANSVDVPTTRERTYDGRTLQLPLTGYYVLLYDEAGNLVSTGFTPVTFTVNSGQTYTIQADDYGDCHFVWWSYSNNNAASDTIAVAGVNVTMTAIYGCYGNTSGLTVDSVDQNGNAIFGYYSVLYDANGIPVETGLTSAGPALAGFTTQTFQTSAGQVYSLQVDSYGRCTFSHWSDGVTRNPRPFAATSNETAFTAVYDCLGGPRRR